MTAMATATTTATATATATATTVKPPSLAATAPLLPAFFLFVSLAVDEAKRDSANFYVATLGRALAQVRVALRRVG